MKAVFFHMGFKQVGIYSKMVSQLVATTDLRFTEGKYGGWSQ